MNDKATGFSDIKVSKENDAVELEEQSIDKAVAFGSVQDRVVGVPSGVGTSTETETEVDGLEEHINKTEALPNDKKPINTEESHGADPVKHVGIEAKSDSTNSSLQELSVSDRIEKNLNEFYDKYMNKETAVVIFNKSKRFFKSCMVNLFNSHKQKTIIKRYQKGRLVDSGDFLFYQYQNSLMAYKYKGTSTTLEIPAYVGNLPVLYLHPGLLVHGFGVIDNYKFRGLKRVFSSDVANTSLEDAKNFVRGINSIKFPNTLKNIPTKFFAGCSWLNEIVLPESIEWIAPNAFKFSRILCVVLNGYCPDGFWESINGTNADIFVKAKCKDSYRKGY